MEYTWILFTLLYAFLKGGREGMKKDALKATSSISNNFNIYYSPQYGLYVYNKDDLIANYEVTDKKAKDDVYFKDAVTKEKLANKILVKSNKKTQSN